MSNLLVQTVDLGMSHLFQPPPRQQSGNGPIDVQIEGDVPEFSYFELDGARLLIRVEDRQIYVPRLLQKALLPELAILSYRRLTKRARAQANGGRRRSSANHRSLI